MRFSALFGEVFGQTASSSLQLLKGNFSFSLSFSVYIWVKRLKKPFYTWVMFSEVSQISAGDPISTRLCLQSHFRRVYLCILFALKYVSCNLAIIRSSLFGLHLGRKTFQNSFYTWVTVSKMSNWNIKSHELLRKMYKAKQSQDRKRLKLVNVLITKETSCWDWQGLVVCPSFKQVRRKNMLFFFFSFWFITYM